MMRQRGRRQVSLIGLSFLVVALQAAPAWSKPGDLDPSFGGDGKVVTWPIGSIASANGVAIQPDGKIVAAGSVGGQSGES
jgi:hypothetical protein